MEDTTLAAALRAHVADEPPMRLTSAAMITAGRRSRRTRWTLGVAGGIALIGVATIAATALRPLAPVNRELLPYVAPPAEVCAALADATASPDPSASTPTAGLPPGLRQIPKSPPPAQPEPDPAARDAAIRVSCYLLSAVPPLFPAGTTVADNPARAGSHALVASPGGMGGGDLEVTATALVTDGQGTGLVIFSVSRQTSVQSAEAQAHCDGPTAKATCRTGPHGERIEIYDSGTDIEGNRGSTVYVYSGHTFILAGAHNGPEDGNPHAGRPAPPLTVDQLIALALDPALKLYP